MPEGPIPVGQPQVPHPLVELELDELVVEPDVLEALVDELELAAPPVPALVDDALELLELLEAPPTPPVPLADDALVDDALVDVDELDAVPPAPPLLLVDPPHWQGPYDLPSGAHTWKPAQAPGPAHAVDCPGTQPAGWLLFVQPIHAIARSTRAPRKEADRGIRRRDMSVPHPFQGGAGLGARMDRCAGKHTHSPPEAVLSRTS